MHKTLKFKRKYFFSISILSISCQTMETNTKASLGKNIQLLIHDDSDFITDDNSIEKVVEFISSDESKVESSLKLNGFSSISNVFKRIQTVVGKKNNIPNNTSGITLNKPNLLDSIETFKTDSSKSSSSSISSCANSKSCVETNNNNKDKKVTFDKKVTIHALPKKSIDDLKNRELLEKIAVLKFENPTLYGSRGIITELDTLHVAVLPAFSKQNNGIFHVEGERDISSKDLFKDLLKIVPNEPLYLAFHRNMISPDEFRVLKYEFEELGFKDFEKSSDEFFILYRKAEPSKPSNEKWDLIIDGKDLFPDIDQ